MLNGTLATTLLTGCLLLSGCDSSFHPYDGQSGYQYQSKGQDKYQLAYIGRTSDKEQDVEMMWHHAAREICRGGSYEHSVQAEQITESKSSLALGSSMIPQKAGYFHISGELFCLAPNFAAKQQSVLSVENFTANELKSGHAAN